MNKNFLKQNVPTHLAFSIMLILSFVLALYTVTAARKIVEEGKNSPAFNVEKRINNNKAKNNIGVD